MPEVLIESIEQFNSLIATGVAVVKFTASWCGPCVRMAPEFKKIASQTYEPATNFLTIDIDHAQSDKGLNTLCQKVRSVPTIHYYQNGKLVDEMVGANIEKLVSKLAALAEPTLGDGNYIFQIF